VSSIAAPRPIAQQIMLMLVTAGAVATGLALPVALGIGVLLAILILPPADRHRVPHAVVP